MSETQLNFEFKIGEQASLIRIKTPDELTSWYTQEFQKWNWLQNTSIGNFFQAAYNLQRDFGGVVQQWRNPSNNLSQIHSQIQSCFQQFQNNSILYSGSPEGIFVLDVKDRLGVVAGAAAYVTMTNQNFSNQIQNPLIIEGVIEGFLYKREIDWTASAHQEVLNRLKSQYTGNISHQSKRFEEIEKQNDTLNATFEEALKTKELLLDTLHENQKQEFEKLIEQHEKNLQAIEKAYDQKLALQKPVQYWKTKEEHHGKYTIIFGIASLVTLIVLGIALGLLVHWAFGDLKPTDNPKHWQIGVVAVTVFFSVWIIRMLIRLFLSHHHLSTDAAERRMMILTYLSMIREGTEFSPEDRTQMIQSIFKSASDGLVKDDGAPPAVFEWLTRK